jgi:hypothetical protein
MMLTLRCVETVPKTRDQEKRSDTEAKSSSEESRFLLSESECHRGDLIWCEVKQYPLDRSIEWSLLNYIPINSTS